MVWYTQFQDQVRILLLQIYFDNLNPINNIVVIAEKMFGASMDELVCVEDFFN